MIGIIAARKGTASLTQITQLGTYVSECRLDEMEYAEAIAMLDLAIHVYNKDHFRIRFSGSTHDKIAFTRPAIIVANEHAKWLKELEPEYGHLVEKVEKACDVIVAIATQASEHQIARQVDAASRLRARLSVRNAADQLEAGYYVALQ